MPPYRIVWPSLVAALFATSPVLAQSAVGSDATDEPPPPPPPGPRFGSRGQWVISGSASASISSKTFDSSHAEFTRSNFEPGVSWFVARNVSLGVVTHLAYSDSRGYGADGSLVSTKATTVRLAPTVGVNLPLGESFSLWPTATFGFEWVHQTESVVSGSSSSVSANPLGYPSSTNLGPWGEVDVSLLWHVRPHLFVGAGAGVFHDFGQVQGGPAVGGQETSVSGGFLLGGWFGGEPKAQPAASDEPSAPAVPATPRFGQQGQVAISNELTLNGYWGSYAGSSSSYSGGSINAGLDYFFADHVSIGAAASASYGTSTGVDATTNAQVTSSSTGASLLVRLGVDIPMGKSFSFWPRASLGGATVMNQQSESKQGSAVTEEDKPVFVGLYAPLLVHPSPHFFVGFGPSVYHDLSHSVVVYDPNVSTTGPTSQNVSTTVGAGVVVGGWL
jgi:hypothetical protein